MRYTRIFLFLFLLTVVCSPVVFAQEALKVFEKELPVYEMEPAEEFLKKSSVYDAVPFKDDLLAYEIALPKNWVEAKSFGYSLSSHVFVEVGRYDGPVKFNEARSFLTIRAMNLDYQTTAKEWFTSNIWKSGYSLQGAKARGANAVEALHIELYRGESYVVRSLTVLNGSRLIQASYYLPMTSWNAERSLQNQVINSFTLKNVVEDVSTDTALFEFLDLFSFEYPVSWALKASNEKTIDLMQIQMLNYDPVYVEGKPRTVNGTIDFKMFSHFLAESLKTEMARHLESMDDRGIIIEENRDKEEILLQKDFSDVQVEIFSVLDSVYPQRKTELWLVGMEAGDHYYVTSLITPARDYDFDAWTENVQAYKLVLGSLKHNLNSAMNYEE